jgi:hypothetical protein
MFCAQISRALLIVVIVMHLKLGDGDSILFSTVDLKDMHANISSHLVARYNVDNNIIKIKHSKWIQRIERNGNSIFEVTWVFGDVKTVSERLLTDTCQVVSFILSTNEKPIAISSCLWSTYLGKECSSNCKLPLIRPGESASSAAATGGYRQVLGHILENIAPDAVVTSYLIGDELESTSDPPYDSDTADFERERLQKDVADGVLMTFLDGNKSAATIPSALTNLRSLSTHSGGIEEWQMSKPIRLFSSYGAAYDNFGTCIAMHDDVVAIGASTRDRGGFVYVFYRQGKTFYQDPYPLVGRQEYQNDFFGWSVDVYERSIAVGAYQTTSLNEDMTSVGAVYVFLHLSSGWTVESFIRLTRAQNQGGKNNNNNNNNAAPTYDNFGWSVSLYENTLVVGAYGDDTVGMSAGAVYTFDRVNGMNFCWSQSQKLMASDGGSYDAFGWSVSLDGNVTVVGAYSDSSDDFSYVGSVYVYHRHFSLGGSGSGNGVGTWSHVAKLTPSDGGFNDFFGWDVAVYENSLVVGSNSWQQSQASIDDVPTGAVYTYTLTYDFTGPMEQKEWVFEAKLRPPGGNIRYFGNTVAMDGENLLVGALGEKATSSLGAAYVYGAYRTVKMVPSQFTGEQVAIEKVEWTRRLLLSPNSTSERDSDFGFSVAVWDGVCLVGALSATGSVDLSGAVFAFTRIIDKTARGHPVSETTYVALVSFLPILFGAVFLMIGVAMVFLKPTNSGAYGYDEAMDMSGISDMSQSQNGESSSVHSVTGLMGRGHAADGGGRGGSGRMGSSSLIEMK